MADPLWAQDGEYPARDDRVLITELWDHGVLRLTSCVATERQAGANFTLDVTGGRVVVAGGSDPEQGNYLVPTVDTTGVTVSSPPSGANKRIDLLVVEVQDDDEDSGGVTGWRYRVVAGTPTTGTPSAPATPINCEALYEIGPIVNGTVAITDDLLTDVRVLAGRRDEPATIKWRGDSRVPSGWLECNGQVVSRSTYAELFATIGEAYGAGDGATTFRLPDLRGRVGVPLGSAPQVDAIGETGGEYTHVLTSGEMPSHTHTMAHTHTGPSHTHSFSATSSSAGAHTHTYSRVLAADPIATGAGPASGTTANVDTATSSAGAHTHTVSGTTGAGGTGNTGAASNSTTSSAGSGAAHNNMQPYQVVGVAVIRT